MAEMMRLQIVTPDEAFFDGEVSMVELNTADGETGIYPKHIPMVVAVAPGVLKIHGADGVKTPKELSTGTHMKSQSRVLVPVEIEGN